MFNSQWMDALYIKKIGSTKTVDPIYYIIN
jgi:hypothetical protein